MALTEKVIERDGSKYYLKQINPYKYKYVDALRTAELGLRSFEDNVLTKYRLPEVYHYKGNMLDKYRQSIIDPRERLQMYINHSKRYSNLCHLLMGSYYQNALDPNFKCYELYTADGEAIGYASMRYPDFDAPRVAEDVIAAFNGGYVTRLLWKVYVRWINIKLFIMGYLRISKWLFGGGGFFSSAYYTSENSSQNDYIRNYVLPGNETELSNKTYDELRELYYPKSHLYLLHMLMLDSRYQGKGLGRILLETAIYDIKADHVEFHDKNGVVTATGPVKIDVKATEEGKVLYDKMGFQTYSKIELTSEENPPTTQCWMVFERK